MTAWPRPAARIAALVALAGALTACGNAQVPIMSSGQKASAADGSTHTSGAPSSSAPSVATSTTNGRESESQTVDGREIAGLPKGFPFPDGAKVDLVVAGSMVQLSAPGSAQIAAFYRVELPKAGLPIDFDSGDDAPVLLFGNEQWQGQVSINSDAGALITWGPPLEGEVGRGQTGTSPDMTPETSARLTSRPR